MRNSRPDRRTRGRKPISPRIEAGTIGDRAAPARNPAPPPSLTWKQRLPILGIGGAILAIAFAWAYFPTLAELVATWNSEPDYSHGFLVAPLAAYFLWARRRGFPGRQQGLAWPGLILIAASIGLRVVGAWGFLGPVDGWSIPVWIAGVVWLFGGWRVLWWSLPSIAFLWFMVPLPYRVERWLSVPLQGVATRVSCWALQSLGQPALAEANVVLLGDNRLEVGEACSGLRIFVGIVALAFAYLILVRRAWWEKVLLLVSVVPIALLANSTRIVATGLLYQYVSGDAAKAFAHDAAGWATILLGAALFSGVLWYLGRLLREVETVGVGAVLHRDRADQTTL